MRDSLFDRLVEVMEKLRSPQGCPWDREQTPESLLSDLLEETYELAEAIRDKNPELIKEELGDLLLQVIFQSQIAKEKGWFTIEEVVENLLDKLVRRHPHVFANQKVNNSEEVLRNWERIKAAENKKVKKSCLDGLPSNMSPLTRAFFIQKRVRRVGFDWKKPEEVLAKLKEEIEELEKAIKEGRRTEIEEEIGDLFFSLVNLSRHLGIIPDIALARTLAKFEKRFRSMEKKVRERGERMEDLPLEELDRLWEEEKKDS